MRYIGSLAECVDRWYAGRAVVRTIEAIAARGVTPDDVAHGAHAEEIADVVCKPFENDHDPALLPLFVMGVALTLHNYDRTKLYIQAVSTWLKEENATADLQLAGLKQEGVTMDDQITALDQPLVQRYTMKQMRDLTKN